MLLRFLIIFLLGSTAIAQEFGDETDELNGPTWTAPEEDEDMPPPPPPPPPFPTATGSGSPDAGETPDSGEQPQQSTTGSPRARTSFQFSPGSAGAEGDIQFKFAKDAEGNILKRASKEERLKAAKEKVGKKPTPKIN